MVFVGFPKVFIGFLFFFAPPKKTPKMAWVVHLDDFSARLRRKCNADARPALEIDISSTSKQAPGAPGSESDLRHNGRLLIITLRVVKLKHWRTVNQGYLDSPIDPHDVLPIWGILRWKTQETQTRWGMVRLQTIDGRWVQPFFWRPRNCHIANIIYWIWYHHYIA